jgi:uncharacterized protein YegJ (DUF2314 family)
MENEEKSKVNIVSLSADDEMLEKFKKQAQDELDYLVNFIIENGSDERLYRYSIKTAFVEDDEVEHMWVQVFDFKDGAFIGKLANDPGTITFLKFGDDVVVERDDVEDWILEDFIFNVRVGQFSLKYFESKKKAN